MSITWAIRILIVLHVVGLFGMLSIWRDTFALLSPVHLFISAFLLAAFHKPRKGKFYIFLLVCFVVGMGAEWLGTKTGYLFGNYTYGPTLGPKWMDVPIIIGINWWMLAYTSSALAARAFGKHPFVGAVAAGIMVFWDFLIEPIAVWLNYWQWEGGHIPLYNYICWFMVALPLQWLAQRWQMGKNNPLVFALFLCQILFFLLLSLLR